MVQTERKKMKLFCIPYSGGSATVYLKWTKFFPKDIEIVPIELAGRGKRIYEPLYETLDEAAEDVAASIFEQVQDDLPYAIYGHSLGSLIAYESYYKLKNKTHHLPCHMFFSGRRAPQVIDEKTEYYKLPDTEFIDIVAEYGDDVIKVMCNDELREVFLPILRSDFKIAETYEWKEKLEGISCDITVINGTQDASVLPYNMEDWEYCCSKSTNVLKMQGDHFFLFAQIMQISNLVSNILKRYIT